MNTTNTIATRPARAYRPCWAHHPRGGKIFGYACKAHQGQRGIATTEENARAGDYFTTRPAAQVFEIENPPTAGNPPRPFIVIPAGFPGLPYDTAEIAIHSAPFSFIRPHDDQTGQISWLKILNSGLAYAVTHAGTYALASLRGPSSASVTEILSIHDTPEEMRTAFFTEQANRRMTQY